MGTQPRRWVLNVERISDETYATFVHNDRIVSVYRIEGHERISDPGPKETKVALIGQPLAATNPVRRNLVGRPAIHSGRNAVNYVSDDLIGLETSQESGQRAFLLTWNPDNSNRVDLGPSVLAAEGDGAIGEKRSTGRRTSSIHIGDMVYLLRQGKNRRGIVGSGRATDFTGVSGPDDVIIYSAPHWDGASAIANYVDAVWGQLVEPDDRLPIEELKKDFPDQNWSPMSSGMQIRPELVAALEARWSSHVAGALARTGGQGRIADSERRKAIEDAAQDWLVQHYREAGWAVRDTRYSGPYDAVATRNGQTLYLESKGTQSNGDAVIVTRGEVEHARANPGDCTIGIWSGMRFADDGEIDPDIGGTIIMPFEPDNGILSPLQYRWEWGAGG